MPRILILLPEKRFQHDFAHFYKDAFQNVALVHNLQFVNIYDTIPKTKDVNCIFFLELTKRTNLSLWWQKNWRLPALIKKFDINHLLLINGFYLKKSRHYTQTLVVLNEAYINRKSISVCLSHINQVIVPAQAIAEELKRQHLQLPIHIIYPTPLKTIMPLNEQQKAAVRLQKSDNQHFFYCDVSNVNDDKILFLLKAFSVFKKWQLSSMQLLLKGIVNTSLTEKMETYKYKDSVKFINEDGVNAAAYAIIHLEADNFSTVYKAWQLHVPVISVHQSLIQEINTEAFLPFEENNYESLGSAMIKLYKDELHLNKLVLKGIEAIKTLDVQSVLSKLWQLVTPNN